jgi:hypothetical protein
MRKAIFLILLFVFLIVKAQDEEISRQNKLFLFKVNTTQCSMYSNKCFVKVSAKDLDLNSIKSENDKLFTVISVTKCEKDSPNNTQLCPDFDYFNLTSNSEEYSIYIIKLDPISFGPANLTFFNEENKIFHFVSITEPRRWIDILFDVYGWIFQLCISLIMGCLLDWEILKKLLVA